MFAVSPASPVDCSEMREGHEIVRILENNNRNCCGISIFQETQKAHKK